MDSGRKLQIMQINPGPDWYSAPGLMIYNCFTSKQSKQLYNTLMVEKVKVNVQNWGFYLSPKTHVITLK